MKHNQLYNELTKAGCFITRHGAEHDEWLLWFDVGIKRYTTFDPAYDPVRKLWFDVGFKMYIIQREWHRGYAQYQDSWNIGKNMPSVDEIKLNVK